MRLLLLHASRLAYELTQKTSLAEEITEDQRKADIGECLAVYVTVEAGDPGNMALSIEGTCKEIKAVYGKVDPKRIVLNPFAHLSKDLASPQEALSAMKLLEEALSKEYEVLRCPSGWYKRIFVDNKGHPLAALGRTVALSKEMPGREFKKEIEPEPETCEKIVDKTLTADLIEILIDLRNKARDEKNWLLADEIRERLSKAGITLEDHSLGTKWKKEDA